MATYNFRGNAHYATSGIGNPKYCYADSSNYPNTSNYSYNSSTTTVAIVVYGCANSTVANLVASGKKVKSLKCKIRAKKYSTSTPSTKNISVRAIHSPTGQSTGTYQETGDGLVIQVAELTTTATTYTSVEMTETVKWINANPNLFTKLGLRFWGAYWMLYDIWFVIEFEDTGTILYDSYFNFKKWKSQGIGSGNNATISNITDIGFTVKGNVNDSFTNYSPVYNMTAGSYTIAVDSTGGSSREVFVFCSTDGSYNYDASKLQPSYNPSFNFTVWSTHPYIFHRCDVNTSGETITYSNFRVVPSSDSFRLNTVTASQRVNDSGSWGTIPTPTRTGYDFVGWYDTPATSGGTKYTSSSAFPTSDIILWSRWTIKTYKITTSAGAGGTITSTKTVNYGSSQSITATADTGYVIDTLTVDGTTISAATGKDTYTYNFSNVTAAHTVSVTYKLTAQPPEFTSVSMLYKEQQITQNNKVPAGQGFRISVRLQ